MASPAQNRRNEIARELGFANDYDRRIRGGAGATPESPRPEGLDLAQARGHPEEFASRLLAAVEPESTISFDPLAPNFEKDASGAWKEIHVTVDTPSGERIEFTFKNMPPEILALWLEAFDDIGVDYDPDYDLGNLAK